MRRLSDRTIKSYQNNNLALFLFIKDEYSITELEEINQLIMVILLDTGIRNSVLCGLRLSDISDTYINIFGKGKKIRRVPISLINMAL